MTDWSTFLSAMVLAMVRVSGMVLFAPFFSSTALPVRAKAVFVLAVAFLLAPLVAALPNAHAEIGFAPILGELAVGLVYGLALAMLNEMLLFAGQIAGMQFSFSLVNLMDPSSPIETPLLGTLFQMAGTLVIISAGLDRILLASMMRSFRAAPLGSYAMTPATGLAMMQAASGVFVAAVELAAPVLAATLLVEIATSLMGKLSPQLPVMFLSVPMKQITGFVILAGSLALWSRFIEARFGGLLDMAERLIGTGVIAMPGDRTEQATQHRRDKARKEGDMLHSRDLTAAAGMLGGVLTLAVTGSQSLLAWREVFSSFLDMGRAGHWEPEQVAGTMVALRGLSLKVLEPMALVMAAVAAAALIAAVAQTGGVTVYAGAVGFKLERISPMANAKNIFSLRAAARLGKSLLPAALLALFAVQRIARQMTMPPFSTARLEILGEDVFGLLQAAAWLLFGWALVDYMVEWQSRESRLRMSREDMREEYKETEGSPQVRGRIRNLQRQMRRRRVKADVSRAAVVLTNPTHYAVALGFDRTETCHTPAKDR